MTLAAPAAELLKVQLRHAWSAARWVVDGLDADEYFWEPVPDCWSVRRRAPDVRGWGSGDFVCEDAWPPPDPLPVTTIAWRVTHTAAWTDVYHDWTFGEAKLDLADVEVPGNAEGGLAWLFEAQDRFIAAVDEVGDDELFEPRPAHWGEPRSIAYLVSSMLTEIVHHSAEVGVLRDVRRGRARTKPMPVLEGPAWWTAQGG